MLLLLILQFLQLIAVLLFYNLLNLQFLSVFTCKSRIVSCLICSDEYSRLLFSSVQYPLLAGILGLLGMIQLVLLMVA